MTLRPSHPAAAPPVPQSARRERAHAAWDHRLQDALRLDEPGEGAPEAWFLGPRAENVDLLRELVLAAIDSHVAFRKGFHPEDPTHITPAIRNGAAYQAGADRLRRDADTLLNALRLSAPFASMRYQGHMLWDTALPATIGLIAALLYNQNNVAAEASPVTTRLEIEVGNDLCRMLGYTVPLRGEGPAPGCVVPWGHITSGGTVANIEALWAARNLAFAPVGLRAALREVPALQPGRTLEVPVWGGGMARLTDLDTWTLLNLDVDVVAGLPTALAEMGVAPASLQEALAGYAVQNTGLITFYRNFMPDVPEPPVFLAPATGHYSWPKAATVLGLGQNSLLVQRVDQDARLDLEHVEMTLTELLRRRVPVLCAVAVLGSTEESAVDPLAELLELRDRFQARGLNFMVHADAAWGGYFRTTLRDETQPDAVCGVPTSAMGPYARTQYEALGRADSITVDPHKGGYVPYPAGALCYRNAAIRDLISLRAPVVFHSQAEPTVGIYGLEGSKPGSAAAAVWLAHKVIRPDASGYGKILGQCLWTSKRLFCRLATLKDPRFRVTCFNRTPAERAGKRPRKLAEEREVLRSLVELDNNALAARLQQDTAAADLFSRIGSDQVILAFALNFRLADGTWNDDLLRANLFNDRVFGLCSLIEPREDMGMAARAAGTAAGLDLILTSSRFDRPTYGAGFVDAFCDRMGVVPRPETGVDFLISTSMDPWTTDTAGGDFLQVVEDALRAAAHRTLDDLGFEGTLSGQG